GAEALVRDAGGCQQGVAEGAGQGHDPRIAEPQGRGPPPVRGDGRVRDPLEGWTRKDGALAGALGIQDTAVDRPGLGLQFVQVGQVGVAGQVNCGQLMTVSIRSARPSLWLSLAAASAGAV